MEYNIRKITDNKNINYDKYIIEFKDGKNCYYYEAYNNKFVNVVEVVLEKYNINKLDNNKIYVFLTFDDIAYIRKVLEVFNKEFSNLTFNMLSSNKEKVLEVVKGINIDYNIISINEKKFTSPIKKLNKQYVDYDLKDNIYIKKDNDKELINDVMDREYANYNGYNERLIDKNVENIVKFKNNNDNNQN